MRLTTRRRLVVAFSAVLVASLSALAFQVFLLRRLEVTFASMAQDEEQMRLALRLEDAIRDQYREESRFAAGGGADLAGYEAARSRALEMGCMLGEKARDPDVIRWIGEITETGDKLDRMIRDRVVSATPLPAPAALAVQEEGFRLVLLIEHRVDAIFARLQQAASGSRDTLVHLVESALRWTAALLVITPLLVAGAVLYLSRSVARPLARLSEGAAAIAAGDLEARIDVDTPDEFGALAAEFNEMTASLRRHQERLVESEKLAGIGRLAAGVAHELNNPLQVMLGYLSLNRDVRDPRLAKHLATMEEQTLRCAEIIEGMLALARPQSVAPVPVDLRELCEDVSGRLQVALRRGAPRLSVDGSAVALADGPKVGQVLHNLMKNAAEAAGPTGVVDVLIGGAGDEVEVSVRDSGPGIGQEARTRLFEPFFTTKPSGTGLGLAVSRAIARAHGGDIEVRNSDSGGAVFTLRLPRAPEERI